MIPTIALRRQFAETSLDALLERHRDTTISQPLPEIMRELHNQTISELRKQQLDVANALYFLQEASRE